MQPGKVRLRTYRQVWLQEHVIYQIERVRLPFPITLRQVGIFTAMALAMAVLSQLPLLKRLPTLVRYGLMPGLAAWYLTQQRLDGKPPHRWALSWARYMLSPRRLNRFRPLAISGKVRFAPTTTRLARKG